jgi:hypothetical protein
MGGRSRRGSGGRRRPNTTKTISPTTNSAFISLLSFSLTLLAKLGRNRTADLLCFESERARLCDETLGKL